MTKKIYNYKSHDDMSPEDYDYITSVSDDFPENISIEEIKDFLNELYDYNKDQTIFVDEDFDNIDMSQLQKELGI